MVLYGSILRLLVTEIMPDAPEVNLAAVWARVQVLYKDLDIKKENRYGNLKLTMFKLTGTAKLRGKAGEVRAFGAVLCRVFEEHYDPEDLSHRKMLLCLKKGVRMEDILDEHPDAYALPGSPARS